MISPAPVLWLDYVDPVSWALHLEVEELVAEGGVPAPRRAPLELRPPPSPLIDPEAPWWRARWEEGAALAARRGLLLAEPSIVPWTRKAHELTLHAEEKGSAEAVRAALFAAFLGEGTDLGRVDVLIRIATSLGLDRTETKAVLDVDRHAEAVVAAGERAAALGLDEPPALTLGTAVLRGFHNRDRLRTFLCSS